MILQIHDFITMTTYSDGLNHVDTWPVDITVSRAGDDKYCSWCLMSLIPCGHENMITAGLGLSSQTLWSCNILMK